MRTAVADKFCSFPAFYLRKWNFTFNWNCLDSHGMPCISSYQRKWNIKVSSLPHFVGVALFVTLRQKKRRNQTCLIRRWFLCWNYCIFFGLRNIAKSMYIFCCVWDRGTLYVLSLIPPPSPPLPSHTYTHTSN